MTKITSSPNCGNSPKMAFLKEFKIAYATGNVEFLVESITDEIVWNIVGDKRIQGKENVTDELEKRTVDKATTT
ncbi:hypothetical protein J2X69_004946 [Algoriphagus sp. 4150]|uniref:hypothetical protein n=1 Tax=Algoriphagus sp. 4150 TaxID=2817756 RepID=UPI0028590DA3|nr:hypothetical protein [Algoriphagus sp. 4150]MDR7132573.1 hypothetical protein [Algoriphagus sp. 4150]